MERIRPVAYAKELEYVSCLVRAITHAEGLRTPQEEAALAAGLPDVYTWEAALKVIHAIGIDFVGNVHTFLTEVDCTL